MTLKLNGSSSGSVSIDAPASTTSGADITFKLPVADGSSGQALVTDASGNLSFATAGVTQTVGTWTPSDGSGNGLTFSTAVGHYVLMGKLCTVFCHTVWPSTSASGQVVIAGLPATVKNIDGSTGWDMCGGAGRVSTQGPNVNYDLTARGAKNTTTVKIWGTRGDGGSGGYAFPISVMGANASGVDTAGGILQFSLTYQVE